MTKISKLLPRQNTCIFNIPLLDGSRSAHYYSCRFYANEAPPIQTCTYTYQAIVYAQICSLRQVEAIVVCSWLMQVTQISRTMLGNFAYTIARNSRGTTTRKAIALCDQNVVYSIDIVGQTTVANVTSTSQIHNHKPYTQLVKRYIDSLLRLTRIHLLFCKSFSLGIFFYT